VLELNLWRFSHDDPDRVSKLKSIVSGGKSIAERSNREAARFLMESISLGPLHTRNDSYFAEAVDYMMALLHAHLDEPEAAGDFMRRSNVLPFDGGAVIFSEAVTRALQLSERQEEGLRRHAPAVFLSSMPRSASAALASTIAELFECPIMRASIGGFPDNYLVPFWVNRLSRGACVLHDHFGPNEFNRLTLSRCGIRTVFVLIRDPRAAAVSAVQHSDRSHRGSMPVTEENILTHYERAYLPWLRNWDEYAASQNSAEVVWLRSGDVTAGNVQLRAVIEKMIEPLMKLEPDWRPPDLSKLVLADANFVTGSADGWRNFVSKSAQERMWAGVPPRFREMLELKP
jgi:hypothetical protein